MDKLLIGMCVLMICDYITGVISAYINKQLSSKMGINGLLKKVSVIILITALYVFDSLNNNAILFVPSATFYVVNEILSITENLNKAGIHIPDFIKSHLNK